VAVSGTTNTVVKFTSSSTIGNSNITDTGSLITLGSNSYVNGGLGIGQSALTGYNLRIGTNITGAATSYGIFNSSSIQSDVTTTAIYNRTVATTQAASFTLPNIYHYFASQGTFGAGSSVTTQAGFYADNGLIGATNNYGFRGSIASGTGRWNLYMDGTANNYMAGSLGIGATALTGINLYVGKNITGATTAYGVVQNGTVQSGVTSTVYSFVSSLNTSASAFTLSNYYHFYAAQNTIGATSAVTNQYGFIVENSLTGATNNYAFFGNIASGTNRWNIYMGGTANNYIAGSLGIGSTSLTGYNLRIAKTLTGSVSSTGIQSGGAIQSDVTSDAQYFSSAASTAAASFTITDLAHYIANQGTFGVGSTVTKQYGFRVAASLIGATNNYAFFSDIASGTNRWNLYMNGTAANYMAGTLSIGTTNTTAAKLVVDTSNAVAASFGRDGTDGDVVQIYNGATATTKVLALGVSGNNATIYSQFGNLILQETAGNIGIGASTINASAKVQIDSTTQGVLISRMTSAQRTAISSPATGLLVYQTDGIEGFYVYSGGSWKSLTMV
jgi:hypothetical protein